MSIMSKNGQGRRRDAIIIYLLGRVDWYPAKAATAVQPAYPNLFQKRKILQTLLQSEWDLESNLQILDGSNFDKI